MKNIPSFFLLFLGSLLISAHSQCMLQNSTLGPIDKLALARFVSEKKYDTVLQEINQHEFDKIVFGQPNPFQIVLRCVKNDGSELSTTVFSINNKILYGEVILKIKNQFNQHHTAIDEYTRCTGIKDGSKDKLITTSFHDKTTLLAALSELQS